jgi:hypothetical protein
MIGDGATEVRYYYDLLEDNGVHRRIYSEHEYSQQEIETIPEFPSLLILPPFIIATLLAVMTYRRKPKTK